MTNIYIKNFRAGWVCTMQSVVKKQTLSPFVRVATGFSVTTRPEKYRTIA
jgi:hypothetical protein